jgi:diguanylate cyclase (GGDEF)-like protein
METNCKRHADAVCKSVNALTGLRCSLLIDTFRISPFSYTGMVVFAPFSGTVHGHYLLALDESIAERIFAACAGTRRSNIMSVREECKGFWEEVLNIAVGESILELERFFENLTYFPPAVSFGEIFFPPLLTGIIDVEVATWKVSCATLINLANPKIVERLKDTLSDLVLTRKIAATDPLTGLYNRSCLETHLAQATGAARKPGTGTGVLMIDVDHFKAINDTYGHDTGDTVLRAIGRAILDSILPTDAAIRYGGDEFIVILPGRTLAECHELGNRIQQEVRRRQQEIFTYNEVAATVSIGAAQLKDGEDIRNLLLRTDKMLYSAKNAGRDRVVSAP